MKGPLGHLALKREVDGDDHTGSRGLGYQVCSST